VSDGAAPSPLVVLVTGATGSGGRATVQRFAGDGARVALNGSDPGRLEAEIRELGLTPEQAVAAPGDLTRPEAALEVVAAVEQAFGRLDVVAHLVGGYAGGTEVADLDHDEVNRMLDQHLWTTLNILQAAIPGMRERGYGRLIAVSTPFAATPGPRGAAYAIGKSAVDLLLRSAAKEVAADGVTANVVIMRTLDDERSRAQMPNAKRNAWTTPEELAEAIAWLASPAAAAVNGARIPLDGRG
jgi:NAD(P)-dependent dehydrogenase (short-subunit alcohol dehydrogenase family)